MQFTELVMLYEIECVLNNCPLCFTDDDGVLIVLMPSCLLNRKTLSLVIITIYGEMLNVVGKDIY